MIKIAKLSVLITLTVLATVACNNKSKQPSHNVPTVAQDTVPVVENLLYGINLDDMDTVTSTVKRNQFLSNILQEYNVPYQRIDELVQTTSEVFDVRKIKVGNPYTIFWAKDDSAKTAKYFVYELNKIDYVVYSLGDTITAVEGVKPVVTKEKTVTGKISSSLWNAMVDKDANPMLAVELSDVYAWTIDFFGISKGDYFKVIYTEDYVDSTSVGINEIKAAVFNYSGKDFYAFYFNESDSISNFYDEEGKSLRKTFLKAPLKYSRISSRFSNSRMHPILKRRRAHHGVDYAAPTGTPVHTIGDGKVIAKGYQAKGGGNYLKVKHNSVYTTVYMHLNGFAKGISQGKVVKQGDLIGYVGATGLATGPHLDFRVFKNGKAIDPLKMDAPPAAPIKEGDKARYKEFYTPLKSRIDSMKVKRSTK